MSEADAPRTDDPWKRALRLLDRREHSRRELARKLAQAGASPDAIEQVLARLTAKGWQDDCRFAGALARTRAAAGQGPQRIRVELAGHGLDDEVIEEALASCEADWRERARALVGRRYPRLADPAVRRKALAFLLRRGFDPEIAREALRPPG